MLAARHSTSPSLRLAPHTSRCPNDNTSDSSPLASDHTDQASPSTSSEMCYKCRCVDKHNPSNETQTAPCSSRHALPRSHRPSIKLDSTHVSRHELSTRSFLTNNPKSHCTTVRSTCSKQKRTMCPMRVVLSTIAHSHGFRTTSYRARASPATLHR